MNIVMIRDALGNLSEDSGASDDYCRGIVVGVVATRIVTMGETFAQALGFVMMNLPNNARASSRFLPESWRK